VPRGRVQDKLEGLGYTFLSLACLFAALLRLRRPPLRFPCRILPFRGHLLLHGGNLCSRTDIRRHRKRPWHDLESTLRRPTVSANC